jgi:hypothetical protein
MEVIAETKLLVLYSDGQLVPVVLQVGRPTPHEKGNCHHEVEDWDCEVAGTGLRLFQGSTRIRGLSSWDALVNGLRFLREMLSAEVKRGAVFHWEDGEHTMGVEELFCLHEITESNDPMDDPE